MDELKNCPFCKNENKEPGYGVSYVDNEGYFVYKETRYVSCVCLPQETIIPVDVWQTRPIEDALRAEIAGLHNEIADLNYHIKLVESVREQEMAKVAALRAELDDYKLVLEHERAQHVFNAMDILPIESNLYLVRSKNYVGRIILFQHRYDVITGWESFSVLEPEGWMPMPALPEAQE